MSLAIRTATAGDAKQIISVVNAAFSVEVFLDGTRTDEQRLAAMMNKGEFLVGESAGRIVASVYVESRGDRGYFGMLAVDPSQQGRGISRMMI